MKPVHFGNAQFVLERVNDTTVLMTLTQRRADGVVTLIIQGTPEQAEDLKNALEDADSGAA